MTPQQNSSVETFPLVPLLVFFGGMTLLLVLVFGIGGSAPEIAAAPTQVTSVVAAGPTATPTTIPPRVTSMPQTVASALDPQMVKAGDNVYQGLCAACHGFNARGIQGIGKTLIGSEYVNGLTDDELHAFLVAGRTIDDPLNTTGMVMPARGGNPSLTDEDLANVVAYIRSLNGAQTDVAAQATPVPTLSGPRPTATEFVAPSLSNLLGGSATEEPTVEVTLEVIAAAPTQAPQDTAPTSFMSGGQTDYLRSCAGCHGVNGEGVAFTGSSLTDNELVQTRNGMAIINFLTAQQQPVDPRVAYPHPYRGGYPELSDQQIFEIVTYLYSLMP